MDMRRRRDCSGAMQFGQMIGSGLRESAFPIATPGAIVRPET